MEERVAEMFENEFTYPNGARQWFELSIQPVPEGLFILSIDKHQNIILWQTASEYNNSHFEVEKSSNGQAWSKIGTVKGAEMSSTLKNYSFIDPLIQAGVTHYRIRQVDNDERSHYSTIVSATHTLQHFMADVYPNPPDASSVVTLYSDHDDEVTLKLVDAQGRMVVKDLGPLSKGTNELSLSKMNHIGKGYYFLHLNSPKTGHSKTIKLLK